MKMQYVVKDEIQQVIAQTGTRWTAERLIEGIKAHDSPTSRMGSWRIEERSTDEDAALRRAVEKLAAEWRKLTPDARYIKLLSIACGRIVSRDDAI